MSGIPFDTWVNGDPRVMFTAIDLLTEQPATVDSDGRQMSG